MENYITTHEGKVVDADSVASIYSLSAYLTRLWQEANALHPEGSEYSLRTRRPDLETLVMSQENMKTTVNTPLLTNKLLRQIFCKTFSLSDDDNTLKAIIAISADTGYYHQPLKILQEILLTLPDEAENIISQNVINNIYTGIAKEAKKTDSELEKSAQVIRLIRKKVLPNDDDIRVLCGYPLSKESKDSEPSQFEKLFGPNSNMLNETAVRQREIMVRVFNISDNDMILLTGLADWKQNAANLDQVSDMYAWILLSSTLGCSLSTLTILKLLLNETKTWRRYTSFKSVIDWQEKQNLSVTDLLLVRGDVSTPIVPAMQTLVQLLQNERTLSGSINNKILLETVCTTFNLSSAHQAGLLLDWLDAETPLTAMNRTAFLNRINVTSARYVLIRRKANAIDQNASIRVSTDEVSDFVVTNGLARENSGNCWIQFDLNKVYSLKSITLIPSIDTVHEFTDCLIYVSEDSMDAWGDSSNVDEISQHYILWGQSSKTVSGGEQCYTDSDLPSLAKVFLNRLFYRLVVAGGLNLSDDLIQALPDLNKNRLAAGNLSRAKAGNATVPSSPVPANGQTVSIHVPVTGADGTPLKNKTLTFIVEGQKKIATTDNSGNAVLTLPGRMVSGNYDYAVALNGDEQLVNVDFTSTGSSLTESRVDLLCSTLRLTKTVLEADSQDNTTITFTAKDSNKTVLSGLIVTFECADVRFGSTSNSSPGIYTATITAGNVSGKRNITIKVNDHILNGKTVALTLNDTQAMLKSKISAQHSVLSVNPASILNDSSMSSTLIFTAKDDSGNLVSGLNPVTFSVSGLTASQYTLSNTVERPKGVYRSSLKGNTLTPPGIIHSLTITVQVNGLNFGNYSKNVSITPTQRQLANLVCNIHSTLTSSTSTLPSDGITTATLTFNAKDNENTPVSGLTDVNVISTLGTVDIVKEDPKTPGCYKTTLKSLMEGAANLSVQINGVVVTLDTSKIPTVNITKI